MKICFLAAGNSAHSHRWIRYFAERGHEIHWISLTPLEVPVLPQAHFYDLSSRLGKFAGLALAALKIKGLIRRIRPDIVHAHYAGSYGVLGSRSGFQPFVLTAWGSDILFAGREWLKGTLVRKVLDDAQLITCDAYHMVDAMVGLGAAKEKIRLIYFGVEVDRFTPGPADSAIRSRWQVGDGPVVISLRNLEPVYDIESLLDAVPAVAAKVPSVRFVIAGSGSLEAALKDRAQRLGIDAHVRFIGRYSNPELPSMLRSCDAYVSTSLSDAGIAASTAEAMACGLPVIVTDTGENGRWIDDGDSGLLVPAKSPAALAERLVQLLQDRTLRSRLSERGRAVIVERDNYEREMTKMEGLYQSMMPGTLAR